jgi:uncharacterized repeat protein (TIGR01451 family)
MTLTRRAAKTHAVVFLSRALVGLVLAAGAAWAQSADLSITVVGPPALVSNTNATYTITVSNAGPSTAAGVTVTDALPPNTTSVSATPSQGNCAGNGTGTVTCTLGAIAPAGSATVTLVALVGSVGTVSNTVTVSSTTTDPSPANNSSTATATVTAPAPQSVPALSLWSLILLALLLAAVSYQALIDRIKT